MAKKFTKPKFMKQPHVVLPVDKVPKWLTDDSFKKIIKFFFFFNCYLGSC